MESKDKESAEFPDPVIQQDDISKALAILYRIKHTDETPWASALDISAILRDEFGLPVHWKTIEKALTAYPAYTSKRKRQGRREYQIMSAGEAHLLPQTTAIPNQEVRSTPPAKTMDKNPVKLVADTGGQSGETGTQPPALFIGSSVEGLSIAYAIQENLEHDAEATIWNQGIFNLSKGTLEDLIAALRSFDFAVFVFSPDDEATIRKQVHSIIRDNVIFELGLFMGALGRERVFFVMPRGQKDLHLPSDLLGITPATFNPGRRDKNLKAALGPASNQIRDAIAAAKSK
jgi:predicted nucleotide-binding protein